MSLPRPTVPGLRPPEPPLRDGDVLLRLWRPSDAEAVAAACQDPEIQRWIPVPAPYGLADAADFIEEAERSWRAGTRAGFAIVHAGSDDLLGAIGLGPGREGRAWSVGYWIAPQARRLGIAARAVRLVSRWAFDEVGIDRLELMTLLDNEASQGVARRAGFHREGVLRAFFDLRGQPQDVVLFSLLADDPAGPVGHATSAADPAGPAAPGGHVPVATTPRRLVAPGTVGAPFVDLLAADDLPPGSLRRVSRGDLDVLLAHTPAGIVATDDRCPHMAAPLSLGTLEGCTVDCPLHRGRFDLCSGETVRMPTTGGLDADGTYHPGWSPAGSVPRPEPPSSKQEARRLTRVRRLRYYPVRVREGRIEVALPPA